MTRRIKNAESRVFLRGLGKGLDKEMGMSGLDAKRPSGKLFKQVYQPEFLGSLLCIQYNPRCPYACRRRLFPPAAL